MEFFDIRIHLSGKILLDENIERFFFDWVITRMDNNFWSRHRINKLRIKTKYRRYMECIILNLRSIQFHHECFVAQNDICRILVMSPIFMFIRVTFFGMFFIFLISIFPVFDHDLLVLRTEIDRFSFCDRLVELLDILSCDIFFPSSRKMSLHDIGECIYENIKWLLIFFFMSFLMLCNILKKGNDISRIPRAIECKFIIARKLHDDV